MDIYLVFMVEIRKEPTNQGAVKSLRTHTQHTHTTHLIKDDDKFVVCDKEQKRKKSGRCNLVHTIGEANVYYINASNINSIAIAIQ